MRAHGETACRYRLTTTSAGPNRFAVGPAIQDVRALFMNSPKKSMDQALNATVAGPLRKRGFKGSLPHLRRLIDGNLELLSFQTSMAGGSFFVNVAIVEKDELNRIIEDGARVERLNAYNFPCSSRRLLFRDASGKISEDFNYASLNGIHAGPVGPENYESIAKLVSQLVDSQAEYWWKNPKHLYLNQWPGEDLAYLGL